MDAEPFIFKAHFLKTNFFEICCFSMEHQSKYGKYRVGTLHMLYDLTFYQKQSKETTYTVNCKNTSISTDKPYYMFIDKVLRISAHAKHVTAIFE